MSNTHQQELMHRKFKELKREQRLLMRKALKWLEESGLSRSWTFRRVRWRDWVRGLALIRMPVEERRQEPWVAPISEEEARLYGWIAPQHRAGAHR